ncbi:HEAT repeat domain-containing protein [Clostridium lundense]|uniref:HEAT repeat domain-containing protein n=1 Tax=Clostridium lundense TaxID=319475 RepID=UPI000683E117|nr:HEAT repeat domain-containing protein [Clostridium lundense]
MGLQDHLIDKISNVLLELGLSDEVIYSFEEYMEGNLEEEEFFKNLPYIDMGYLKADLVEQIVNTYRSLEKYKDYEYFSKYIKILFQIGKVSVFSIIDKTNYSYYREQDCKKFLKYNLNPAFVIAYYASGITKEESSLNRGFIKFYDSIYEEHKDAFKEAFHMSKINDQVIIATYLIHKEKDKELCSWLEEDILNSIEALFNKNISSEELDVLIKYLKGESSKLEETIELLKSNNSLALNIDTYILKFLVGISTTISDESTMANRFIKFAILFDYEKAFNGLYNYLKYNRYNKIIKLTEKLQIKKELYIAWMGEINTRYNSFYFEKELKEELDKNKEEFIKALTMCSSINKAYMASLLWKSGEGLEFVSEGEEVFIHEFSAVMDQLNIEKDVYENFIEYLRDNISFDNISESLKGLLGKKDIYLYNCMLDEVLFWLKDVSPMFERAMKIFIAIGNCKILNHIYHGYKKFKGISNKDEDLSSFIELLDSYGASISNYLSFLGTEASYYAGASDEAKGIIAKLIEKDEEEVIKNIPYCQSEIRERLLEILFKHCDDSKGTKVLIEYLGDSSKVVREKVIELLTLSEKTHEMIIPSLSAKKQIVREAAVKILSKSSNEKVIEALNKALEVEKTEKIKMLLREVLNVESDLEENSEELDILEYCKKALKGNKASGLKWLNYDTLPKVRLKDSEEIAEDEIIKYMLICYSSCIEIGLSSEARMVSELLDKKDLSKLALEVLERWLNGGAESKKKWVLPFASVYGDYNVISLLKKNIEEWPKNSRGAIASEGVKALALNGSNEVTNSYK